MSAGGGASSRRLRLGRLEAYAALAGGVTHEMSNLAASVTMSVQLLEPACAKAADREILASLDELARRIQHAGRQLHWLARGVTGEATLLQPQYLLADLQKLGRVAFPPPITVVTRYPPDLWPLAGDPLTVFQLLLAMFLEAREHLPAAGGTLALAARNQDQEHLDGRRALGAPGAGDPAPSGAAAAGAGRYVVLEAAAEAPAGFAAPSPAAAARRRRRAAEASRAAAAAGGFTTPLPRSAAHRGRRAYLPAGDPESVPSAGALSSPAPPGRRSA
ncbi:MAG TPA: hypothetical protein VKY89_24850 [Thermoanaerobaculia bacterium]|nr:hypothetical protein [Thermoanaerobaculia bacterium]